MLEHYHYWQGYKEISLPNLFKQEIQLYTGLY